MINGLPEKLKELRTRHGFSQKEVALKLGISPSIISGYETGERTPSLEVLLSLSYVYHCSTDYLLGKTSPSFASTIDVDGLRKDQVRALSLLIETMRKN